MNKQLTVAAIAVSLLAVFAVNISLTGSPANAEITSFPSREKIISVTGTATASVEPDVLIVTLGVENQEKTAGQALTANSDSVNAIVEALRNVGISGDEISTSQISIYPVYDSYRDPQTDRYTQELIGYRVINTLTVETSQLDKAADIIDNSVSAGANRVDNVMFTLSPQRLIDLKDDLLAKAVINAKKKAENALFPLDHKIIGVKAVSLSEFGMPPPVPIYAESMAADSGFKSTSTPVFSSEQDISTTANVIFLIGSQ